MARFSGSLQPPLSPRNGRQLEVLVVCRVSDPGPGKQDPRSNDDQEALHEKWLGANTNLPFKATVLAGSGSGECLERGEYLRLIELIESDRFDVVVTEDLGRIVRRIHAHLVAELCVDHNVRLISLNDDVDTAVEGWQDRSIFSAWHHERSNRDTSDRIKRTHRSRFMQGQCLSLRIFGYRKTKKKVKSDQDLKKISKAEPVYREWFQRLDRGELYSEVADWLNASGVPVGNYCRRDKWDGPMVSRTTHNILLKGYRFRNKRKTKRHNQSGKYKSIQADPSDLLLRRVPHLAFFDEAYYDRIIAKVDSRNAKYKRNRRGGPDPCANRPKKRVRFPGQTIDCGICGRQYDFGGNGLKDWLMCGGAKAYKCWNGVSVNGPLATERISAAVFEEIESIADFEPEFVALVNDAAKKYDSAKEDQLRDLRKKIGFADREIDNLLKFIRGGDKSPRVRANLNSLEVQQSEWLHALDEVDKRPENAIVLPSVDEIKAIARGAFQDLAADSYEFSQRLRVVTGRIVVWPFRAIDGGHIVLRARFRLHLANLLADKRLKHVLELPMERVMTIDLFQPAQRLKHREAIMEGRKSATERNVAATLGLTITAAQRASHLDRLMQQHGIKDPYVQVMGPPPDYTKMRRHLHPRYRFEPLPGYIPRW